ncbi:MAG: hypothetical protein JO235_02125 [Chroococcidiopsidaceae cyanobacterium CP_BM_RX_35]|nr:hypothetical protein [Chroococcidiopsidaceae cyanobacterium CP_BM_RX_35]
MSIAVTRYSTQELAEWGWRREVIAQPDGTIVDIQVPLTSAEFLHPQEGFHLPNSTFHDHIAGNAKDLLARRYAHDPTTAVYRDLVVKWGIPGLVRVNSSLT